MSLYGIDVFLEQEKDLESFKDFVSRKRPEAIALAAESRYNHYYMHMYIVRMYMYMYVDGTNKQ